LILFIIILVNDSNTFTNIIQSTTTTQSIYAKAVVEILKMENVLKRDEEQLKIDRQKFEEEKKQMQKDINNIDVIQLNVGGQIIMTTRETLT
jgi:diphthamide biosynthesis methyltransferase